LRQWRKSIHRFTGKSCIYCGNPSESIDHVIPRCQGGLSTTENCVPACLSCNGDKSDENALYWYRRQKFYDPRRAMAIRAWLDGDLRLAIRLLQWANPNFKEKKFQYEGEFFGLKNEKNILFTNKFLESKFFIKEIFTGNNGDKIATIFDFKNKQLILKSYLL